MRKIILPLLSLIAILSIVANAFLYTRYSSSRPLMRIGSESITKQEYLDLLEYQGGKKTLNQLAYSKIVQQAAKKAGITITPEMVDERYKLIEQKSPESLLVVKNDPTALERFRKVLADNIALEELCIKDVKVSDTDVEAFYRRNLRSFIQRNHASAIVVAAQNDVDAATAADLLRQNMSPSAISQQRGLVVVGSKNSRVNWRELGDAGAKLNVSMQGKKKGDIVAVHTDGVYLVARITEMTPGGLLPLNGSTKPLITRLARVAKADSTEKKLAQLYKEAGVKFEVSKYAAYFTDIEDAADSAVPDKKVAVNQ